jgi:hypothetical protein
VPAAARTETRDDGACLGVIVRFLADGPTCAWYHAGGRGAHRRVLERDQAAPDHPRALWSGLASLVTIVFGVACLV